MKARALELVLGSASVAYPFLVFFGLRVLPARDIAIGLLSLLAMRIAFARTYDKRSLLQTLAPGVALIVIIIYSPTIGLKAYPVLLSLTFGAVFAYSLIAPPTVVERIARLRHPDLPLAVNPYLRQVTIAWLTFFIVNAVISGATAMSGNLRLWTIYNGLISYLAMGTLFGGELLVRQRVRRRFLGNFT